MLFMPEGSARGAVGGREGSCWGLSTLDHQERSGPTRTSRPGPLSRGGISAMKPRYEGFTGTVHLATLLLAYLAG